MVFIGGVVLGKLVLILFFFKFHYVPVSGMGRSVAT
jgi:hypothetical protein